MEVTEHTATITVRQMILTPDTVTVHTADTVTADTAVMITTVTEIITPTVTVCIIIQTITDNSGKYLWHLII